MNWKLAATTFLAVFLAELGDKTQLATLSLVASGASRWGVFLGSSIALVASTLLTVLAGDAIARAIPAKWLERAAAIAFLVIGAVLLAGTFRSTKPV